MDLDGEVIAAAPESFIPARPDRARDPLEHLLDAVGVREVVAAEAELPADRRAGPAPSVKSAADRRDGGEQQHADQHQTEHVECAGGGVLRGVEDLRLAVRASHAGGQVSLWPISNWRARWAQSRVEM